MREIFCGLHRIFFFNALIFSDCGKNGLQVPSISESRYSLSMMSIGALWVRNFNWWKISNKIFPFRCRKKARAETKIWNMFVQDNLVMKASVASLAWHRTERDYHFGDLIWNHVLEPQNVVLVCILADKNFMNFVEIKILRHQ